MTLRGFAADIRGALVEWRRPGESGLTGRSLWRVGQLVVASVIVATNLVGAGVVFILATEVVPFPTLVHPHHVLAVNEIATVVYVILAVAVGILVGVRGLFELKQWLIEERPATAREQQLVLRAPLRLFVLQLGLWLVAAVAFGSLNAAYAGARLALLAAITVAITGATTASCSYLFTERILRSPAARAFSTGVPPRPAVAGVATRAVLAWALGTGLPVLGLVTVGAVQLSGEVRTTASRLAFVMVVVGSIGIAVGLLAVTVAARASADPLDSVREALAHVQSGDFAVRVPVYDGTQIGQLQLGFNQMAAGLAERERIREALGTYVDPDVAERIVQEGTNVQGEEVEVTIMFIDIRNFTAFAERTPAGEVMSMLNRLFGQIVPIIHSHGGRVDKFIGDGLLAVFGAPRRNPHHADRALDAAVEIENHLKRQPGPLGIGIGLNSGPVIAGSIGGAGRLDFSVIGDAVNVAARVEAATRVTNDVILITERTKILLHDSRVQLQERRAVVLKGKTAPVRLYTPVHPPQDPIDPHGAGMEAGMEA